MDKAPPPSIWFQRRRTDPGRIPEDAAGLGTAFGLDLSLSVEAARGPAAAPGAGQPSWARRVLGRMRRR
jgi:hypothetical protein